MNTDISLEPLLNQSTEGLGSNKRLSFVPIDTAGEADHRTPLVITNAAQEVTPTLEKRTIELQNTGDNIVYYGGVGVTSANGIMIYPQYVKVFANIKNTFSIYLVTDGAETSEIRVVEYE